MNEGKVKIAVDLIPLMGYLYEAGILRIDGTGKKVQVSPEFFRATFPIYEVKDFPHPDYTHELSYEYEGITFYCLSTAP